MRIYFKSLLSLVSTIMVFLTSGASEGAQAPAHPMKSDFVIKRIEVRRINPRSNASESGRGGGEAMGSQPGATTAGAETEAGGPLGGHQSPQQALGRH